jgi:hypothetical protein
VPNAASTGSLKVSTTCSGARPSTSSFDGVDASSLACANADGAMTSAAIDPAATAAQIRARNVFRNRNIGLLLRSG